MPNSLNGALTRVLAYEQQRPAIVTAGTQALNRLIPIALRDCGQSAVIGRFLLGLYNGSQHPFDLTGLRQLDLARFEDCLKVLMMDYTPEVEVHERHPDGDNLWSHLIDRWGGQAVAS